jgi:hypothetical protein
LAPVTSLAATCLRGLSRPPGTNHTLQASQQFCETTRHQPQSSATIPFGGLQGLAHLKVSQRVRETTRHQRQSSAIDSPFRVLQGRLASTTYFKASRRGFETYRHRPKSTRWKSRSVGQDGFGGRLLELWSGDQGVGGGFWGSVGGGFPGVDSGRGRRESGYGLVGGN